MKTETAKTKEDFGDLFKIIGMFAALASNSQQFREWPVRVLMNSVLPPIEHGFYSLYLDELGRPSAGLVWAYLDEATEKTYIEHERIDGPELWNSGDRLWIIELIAEGGHLTEVVKDIRANLFQNETSIKAKRYGPDGGMRIVEFARGSARVLERAPPKSDPKDEAVTD